MISRKRLGQATRWVIVIIVIVPLILASVLGAVGEYLQKAADFFLTQIKRFTDSFVDKIRNWESNSPEGTMARLKKEYTKNE